MGTTPTREELKAILDEWIPKYIRQVVELRSGSRLSAERYNELMNLLITQGDDTIELADTVKKYVEILVEEVETEFEVTTDAITDLANTAISTANNATNTVEEYKTVINRDITSFKEAVNQIANNTVNTVEEYKTIINQDIAAFKESVNQIASNTDNTASLALQTANQLVADMESYRTALSTQVEETFINMRNVLGVQITNEVEVQMQGIQEILTTDINTTIGTLSEEVLTIANTAEQVVNSAIQDIEAYKTDMDVRLDEALREVEESLSAAGEVIKDASVIYAAVDELATLVNSYGERISNLEEFAKNAYSPKEHTHTKEQITDFPTSMPASDVYSWAKASSKPSYTKAEIGLGNVDNTADSDKSVNYANSAGSAPASDVYAWAKASSKPSYTKAEVGLGNVDNTADSAKSVKYAASAGSASSATTAGTCSGNSATATVAAKLGRSGATGTPMTFNWSGQSGQPTWLWGGEDGSSMYVYNPANFNVNYANSAGSAGAVAWTNVSGRPSSMPASDVYSWAKASSKPSYSWSEITSKPTSFTPASHNQAASTITAGTLGGRVQANATAAATVGNAQVRDIYAGTGALTAGSSALTTGTIYIQYE